MSRRTTIATVLAFLAAGAAATAGAQVAAELVEEASRDSVASELDAEGLDWTRVDTDGLQVILSGRAPDEPARFRAITGAGAVVEPSRVIDAMEVEARNPGAAPRFSLEILRNEAGVSVIGLVPARGGEDQLARLLRDAGGRTELEVTNMVETADHPVPAGWSGTLRFATEILRELPRSKVSVEAGRVEVTAVADSDEEKIRLERRLRAVTPEAVSLALDIAAPRPVITPFTLRFVMPPDGAPRFEACAVDGEAARARVLEAAEASGHTGRADCVIGLGVPSASWGEAAAQGIEALAALGGGALTLSDADVSLVAREGVEQARFDTVVSELETALPDLFVLSAILPEPTAVDGTGEGEAGPQEFVASISADGQVQLRGRLYDEAQEAAVLSYGRALFGVADTYIATRADAELPQGWPVRVLAALDALSHLAQGAVVVQPELVAIRGLTGRPRAEAEISGLLSDKLGAQADFRIDVSYREELDPLLNIPTPEECVSRLNEVLAAQKLSFAPGEAVIEDAGEGQIDRLTGHLDECDGSVFEVGGHTDSQGSEGGNLRLSLQRAEAVRDALIGRGVPPWQLVAEGYGEAEPISENETEAGREANRRITFTLLGRRDGAEAPGVEEAEGPPVADDAGEAAE